MDPSLISESSRRHGSPLKALETHFPGIESMSLEVFPKLQILLRNRVLTDMREQEECNGSAENTQ